MLLLISSTTFAQAGNEKLTTVTETRELSEFTSIEISGRFAVTLYHSAKPEVSVTAADKYIEDVETVVERGVLKVNMLNLIGSENVSVIDGVKIKYSDYLLRKPIEVKIGINKLNILNLAGVSNVAMKEVLNTDMFYLSVGDASKANLNLNISDKLDVYMAGSSRVELKGNAKKMEAAIHGASSLTAGNLKLKDTEIELSGASRAEIHSTKSLATTLKGATKLQCTGSPQIIKQDVSIGSSLIIK